MAGLIKGGRRGRYILGEVREVGRGVIEGREDRGRECRHQEGSREKGRKGC